MAKTCRPWAPTQTLLFPPSPREWLGNDHAVYFLLDVVQQLDLSEIEAVLYGGDPRGTLPYHPRMMTALLLYGYCVGIRSSRKLERATYEDLRFRVLAGGEHPDHSRISDFRRRHLKALQGVFVQVLRLCEKAGLVKLGHVALDGSKFRANASKHKALSYKFMKNKITKLEGEIAQLLKEAEGEDRHEDKLYGKQRRGDEIPEELRRRETRLERIRQAMAELEAEAAEARARQRKKKAQEAAEKARAVTPKKGARYRAARDAGKAGAAAKKAYQKAEAAGLPKPDLHETPEIPRHQVPSEVNGAPQPRAQRNFTDPDSRIMVKGGEFLQGYNCQAAVDADSQVIVAGLVTNNAADSRHLKPVVERIEENLGALPRQLSADTGYCSEANLKTLSDLGIDAYVATERITDRYNQKPPRGRIPRWLNAVGRMRRKLRTSKGKKAYALRKQVVEPVFGQIKEARGIRRFLLRGLPKVEGEWALICTGHNLGKLLGALAETGGAAFGVLCALVALWRPSRACRPRRCFGLLARLSRLRSRA